MIEGALIDKAFARIRELPGIEPPPMPGHSVLEEVIAVSAVPQS